MVRPRPMPALRSSHPPSRRVLLVGWDGADWKIASPLLDAGQLPQLANLVANGASGPLTSLPPYLSPMLWNSIATGKYADQHGILGFTTTDPVTGKLAAITSTQRRCKALWNILGEHGLTAHVLGWFASHPAENVTGVCVTEAFPRPVAKGAPWPLAPGSVHPPALADEFAELRLRPEEVDREILRLFVPRAHEIDLGRDRRLEQLAIRLAELYSVHNAAIAALGRGPCDFLAVYYHFIDWVCHDFMDFHPPRRPHIPEREFELYKDVVNSAYRLQDLLLRDLLNQAGPDTTVVLCSDHGFHSDARRPTRVPMVSAGIAVWHRAQGVFAAAGPGIARDAEVAGATVLDIAPTILHLLGLPAAADMDGRVLTAALASGATPTKKIPSYETEPGPFPRPRHLSALSQADEAALLDQFSALGYVDLAEHGPESPAARNDRDNRWNLAITLRHAGKNEAALAVLDRLHFERPEDPRYAYHLALCQIHLGLVEEATTTCGTIADFLPGNRQARLLLAELDLARGDPAGALRHLDEPDAALPADAPGASDPGNSAGLLFRGQALLRLDRLLEACAVLRQAVDADNENPAAWLAYAQALLRAGQPADACACAREAITLAPSMALAHFTLGQSLAVQNQGPEADASLSRARELNPRLILADRALERLQGLPFVAGVASLSEKLSEPPAVLALRAASAKRRAVHDKTLARRRGDTAPVTRIDPPLPAAPGIPGAPAADAVPLVIVSGLPRSGTSLMMQMLARGGLPPMTDGLRTADENNPEGYLEWEEIKNLPRDPGLISRAAGHAVKVVSPLLPHLPASHRYKVIFMRRPSTEIAQSQEKMRALLSGTPEIPSANAAPADLSGLLARHAEATLAALRAAPHIDLLVIDYPTLVADPFAASRELVGFLGEQTLPNAAAMAAAVQPQLHRQRSGSPA